MKYFLLLFFVVFVGCENLIKETPNSKTTLSDKAGYWIRQGVWSTGMTTWVWKDGQILKSWEDSLTVSKETKQLRIEKAKEYIAWHKSLIDTVIKVE